MEKLIAYTRQFPDRQMGEWAAIFGVSRAHMYDLIKGRRLPSIDVALSIHQATDGEVPFRSWANMAAVLAADAEAEAMSH